MQNRLVVQSITATSTFQQLVHPIYATVLSKRFFPSRGSTPTRIRSFRVKDLDDVRVSSSFVRPRCPFWAFALWLFESRALRKGWFPECYRVSGISVEQVEIATAFCPFRRVQLRPHINESLRELENINGSKEKMLNESR